MSATENLSGLRVTVMGLGQFGGGLGAVQFLLDQGAKVTLTDLRSTEQLSNGLQQIDVSRLEHLVLGEHREADFTDADLIVVNPAVKPAGNPFLELAKSRGVELTSEISLFWERCRGKKIVVTGSVGKSTTADLIHRFLIASGKKSRLGGNIGVSLLSEVDEITDEEWIVLELSSFQLADLDRLQPKPDVAVVTNFFPNHLDWHGTLEHYRESKQAALCWQTSDQLAILNGDDADSALWPTDARVVWYGHEVWQDRPGVHIGPEGISVRTESSGWRVTKEDLAPCLQTEHGMMNIAAALAAVVVGMDLPILPLAPVITDYSPLPHRFEQFAEVAGRVFINDSKATTPEATIAALKSLTKPVILIAGGKEKGVDLTALATVISKQVKAVSLLGETAAFLQAHISFPSESSSSTGCVYLASDLPAAVQWAWSQSAPGDVILLSPGCASHGEFLNFEQRGECFAKCVQELMERHRQHTEKTGN